MTANTTSSSEHSSALSVFGVIVQSNLNFDYTVLMVTLIVFFVVFVEKFFEFLKKLTNDTPFYKVIPALEGELMVIGFTAFVFKIYLNAASSISPEYHYALEYSDILVPFFSFSGCFLGLLLIVASIQLSENWSKGYHANNYSLINEFFEQYHSWRYWIPSIANSTLHRIEFKILHHIFCEMFKLKISSFAYDEYVEIVFEKFILRLIHTDPVHWLLFFALLLAEWGRSKMQITLTSCPAADSSGSTANIECLSMRSTNTFLMAGAVMYGISWIFVLASRYYELCFIRIKGIESMEFYPAYLYYMEKGQPEESRSLQDIRKDEDDLKKLVSAAIERLELAKNKESQSKFVFPSLMPRDATVKPTPLKKQKTAKLKSVIVHDTEKNGDPIRFNETMDRNTSQIATDNHRHHTHHASEKDAIVEDLSDEDVNRKSFSPEHLAFYIDPESYFGEKQKHAPTVDAVSMTNVIHALYSPPPNKRDKTNQRGRADDMFEGDRREGEEGGEEVGQEDSSVQSFSCNNTSPRDKFQGRHRSSKASMEENAHSFTDGDLETGKLSFSEKAVNSSNKDKHTDLQTSIFAKETSLQSDATHLSIAHDSSKKSQKKETASDKQHNSTDNKNMSSPASAYRASFSINVWNRYSSTFLQKKENLRDTNIFFLSRPYLYFEGIKLLLMLIALYCALWLIQYLPADTINAQAKVLCVVPLILTFFNFVIVVKSAVLLKAIHEIDRESMMEVIEQTEGARSLEDLIRSRLVERLTKMEEEDDDDDNDNDNDEDGITGGNNGAWAGAGNNHRNKFQYARNPEEKLHELFQEIDIDKDGFLSRSELTRFLHSLDIYFSRRKWQQIFRQMDKNQDDDQLISMTEFSMFVFPESSSALEEERNRIQKLKEEAKRRTLEFAQVLEKLHPKK